MKVAIWTSHPSHHQSGFLSALRAMQFDVAVRYVAPVSEVRLKEGWEAPAILPEQEKYITADVAQELALLPSWRERIHVVSGYGSPFLRELAVHLSREGASWVHWSEDSTPGWRWWAGLPRKRWYGNLVNRAALGAFGYGQRAMDDFRRWGIRQEKIGYICYSVPACDQAAIPDAACERFKSKRFAFLYLGSLYHGKGSDVLLAAFRNLKNVEKPPVLLMVGNDRTRGKYDRMASNFDISDRVLFRGPVAASKISSILKAADVLVLPSRYDGWGVVINEAASMGLPIIASNHCGAAFHIVESGWNGFRFESGDSRSLTAAMQTYVNAPELSLVHGARSLKLFQSVTPEANAMRFAETIETWIRMKS